MTDAAAPSSAIADTPAPRSAACLLAELRSALGVPPKERAATWEDETSKLVGLLAVDFMKQEDDAVALEEAALVTLAAQAGCKAARKRSLPVARWARTGPPSTSQILRELDEARSAVRFLSQIRSPWVLPYVASELAVPAPLPLCSDLGTWALQNAPDLGSLLKGLTESAQASPALLQWLPETLGSLLRSGMFTAKPMGPSFVASFHDMVALLLDSLSPLNAKDKETARLTGEIQTLCYKLADAGSAIDPALLLHPVFADSVRRVSATSKSWPRASLDSLAAMGLRTINQLCLVLPMLDPGDRPALKAVVDVWAKTLPDFEKALKRTEAECPALGILSRSATDAAARAASGHPLEEALIGLLPEWDAYLSDHTGDPALTQLGLRIDALSGVVGVRRFGKTGEAVDYQPLRHHLVSPGGTPPARVIIVRSGFVIARADGSERVLLKALAEVT